MVSDIAMLSVPIYLIWNLQMSVRRKIGISLIFGTGGLSVFHYPHCGNCTLISTRACISSMIRLHECLELAKTEDYTYRKMRGVMWWFVSPPTPIKASLTTLPTALPN